jgi:hypothetical protein
MGTHTFIRYRASFKGLHIKHYSVNQITWKYLPIFGLLPAKIENERRNVYYWKSLERLQLKSSENVLAVVIYEKIA